MRWIKKDDKKDIWVSWKAIREVSKSVWFFNRAKSWQEAGDLFFWCKKYQKSYIDSLTISSLTMLRTKEHLILISPSSYHLWFFFFCPHSSYKVFFHWQFLHSMIFEFSSHISSSSFRGFLLINLYPIFLSSLLN